MKFPRLLLMLFVACMIAGVSQGCAQDENIAGIKSENKMASESWISSVKIYQIYRDPFNPATPDVLIEIFDVQSDFYNRESWVDFDITTLNNTYNNLVSSGCLVKYSCSWNMFYSFPYTDLYFRLNNNDLGFLWLKEYTPRENQGIYEEKEEVNLLPNKTYKLQYGVLEVN